MRTVEELYGQMMADFTARTGMEVSGGGDLSARLYAAAAQIYGLYVQADWVNRQCFPQTAQGEYLDHHAQLRALERKKASYAQGTVRFFGDGASTLDREISAGTVCMTPGMVRFVTVEKGMLAAGETHVDIPVRATEAGSAGNVIAGSVRMLAVAPVGITGCTNPCAMSGGTDAEDDEQLRKRIMDSFLRLPNGANCAYYEREAMSFEEVVAATVLPRNRGIGTVDVVVTTASGAPGQELLNRLRKHFEERREISVDVEVLAPKTVPVDVTVRIKSQDMEQVRGVVEQMLRKWFTGQRLGENVLRAKLGSLVFSVDGVDNYVLQTPAEDIMVEKEQLPILGRVIVEEME